MGYEVLETADLDYEKVVDIFFKVGFLQHPDKRAMYKKAIEEAFRNSQYVVSVWKSGEMVGFARVLTDKSIFATIWNMLVEPKYQRLGVGRLLLERCLANYPTCHFFLIADKEVEGFYEKMGFRKHENAMYWEAGRRVCVIYN